MAVLPGYGIRVTLFFDDEKTGWSETHYDSVRTTLQGAITTAINTLAPARQNLMAAGPWLKYIRASKDGTFRDSQVAFLPAPPLSNQQLAGQIVIIPSQYINNQLWATRSAAVEWTVALLRGVGGDLYRKNIYISGVPYTDAWDVGQPSQDAVLVAAAQAYATVLTGQGYGFPTWTRDPVAVPPVAIAKITQPAPPLLGWNFQTTVAHGLPTTWNPTATTWRAFLHGLRFNTTQYGVIRRPPPSPNGGFKFQVLDPFNFYLPEWVFPGPNQINNYAYVAGSGTVQPQQRAVSTYQQSGGVLLERFTHRKRGRPFDSPVGRSRARRISVP